MQPVRSRRRPSCDENAAFYPVTAYGESKVRVEQEVSKLADDTFSPVYLRNATAYGVSRRLRADIVVNNLVGHAVTTGKVLLQSDGTPWRPLVHFRDIIHAFEVALTAPIETDPQPVVQRRTQRRELPDPRGREHGRGGRAELQRRVRARRFARYAQLPRGLQQDRNEAPRLSHNGRCEKASRSSIRRTSGAGLSKEEWLGPRYYRLRTVKGLQERGVIDGDLRRVQK